MDDALRKGASVLAGGGRVPALGPNFYAPTLLGDATSEMVGEKFDQVVTKCSLNRLKPCLLLYQVRHREMGGGVRASRARSLTTPSRVIACPFAQIHTSQY